MYIFAQRVTLAITLHLLAKLSAEIAPQQLGPKSLQTLKTESVYLFVLLTQSPPMEKLILIPAYKPSIVHLIHGQRLL